MKPPLRMDKYSALVLLLALVWNLASYYGGRLLAAGRTHHDLTLPVDSIFPFWPWTLCIYVGAFLFWCVGYYIAARQEREKSDRFFCADLLGKALCFICFILLPTTNLRPELTDSGFWSRMLGLLYQLDQPNNLFPSIHCFASWLCWAGARRRELPAVCRWLFLGSAAAICLSTLTIRQHVLADVIAGVLLAEGCFALAGRPQISRLYSRLIDKALRVI